MKAPTSKRLPRTLSSDTYYTSGLRAGTSIARQTSRSPDALNDAFHRGHSAGMYAATALLAERLGITL